MTPQQIAASLLELTRQFVNNECGPHTFAAENRLLWRAADEGGCRDEVERIVDEYSLAIFAEASQQESP